MIADRYVTSLENRAQKLEGILAKFVANSDMERLLSPSPSTVDFNAWVKSDVSGAKLELSSQKDAKPPSQTEGPPDTLPLSSNGFEWTEQHDSIIQIADGMAAFSVDPQGAGYLGE